MRTTSRKSRIIATAVAFVVGAAAYVAMLPTSEAVIIGPPKVCAYYKDATYKKVIGARGTGCCGEPISWGSTSIYVKCQTIYCLDVVCPDDTI